MLTPVPRDEAEASARGIKRNADKLLLPPSVEARLLSQDVARNGPMFFELTSTSGRKTHAVRGGAALHAGALRLCSIAAIVKYILAVGSGGAGKAQAGDIIFTKIMTKHSYIDSIC